MENADKNKVLKMALFHDIPEARTGDANFINKFYSKQKEAKACQDQTKNIPAGKEIKLLLGEFNRGKTKEAIVAKDADTLDQLFLEKEILNEKSEDFVKWHEFSTRKLKTKSAKNLAKTLKTYNSMQWFYDFDENLKKE